MTCCSHCRAAESQFSSAIARRDLARYRRRGPDRTTQLIIDGVRSAGGNGGTLLDIGGGIGVLNHEMLGSAVTSAVHVEASSAYIDAAMAEAERRGSRARVEFVHGNFVDLAPAIAEADLVTMDRVVCCYPQYAPLIERAAAKTRHLIVLSLPKDVWYVRVVMGLENLMRRFRGNAFRTFVHPVALIDKFLRGLGFQAVSSRDTFIWRVAIYRLGARPPNNGASLG